MGFKSHGRLVFQIKRLIKGDDAVNEVSVVERFAAGSSAGAFSQTVIYPMEVRALKVQPHWLSFGPRLQLIATVRPHSHRMLFVSSRKKTG